MISPLNTSFSLAFTVAMSEAAAAGSLVDRSGGLPSRVARFWGVNICRACGIRLSVRGTESVDWDKPFLIMANHQSYFDIPVLYASLPRAFGMLAKKELFRVPVFSSAMRGVRCIPIDRSNRRQSLESIRGAAEQVRSGKSIVVFPEGTRSPDGKIHDLKKGPFYLAQMAGVPIVPVGIRGTRQVLAKGAVLVRSGDVSVSVGVPLEVDATGQNERERLREAVRAAFAELSGLERA